MSVVRIPVVEPGGGIGAIEYDAGWTSQEANIVKRLRTLPDDAIILLAVTKVRGKIINLAVIGEGKREAV